MRGMQRVVRGTFVALVASALGFGASQALAAPAAKTDPWPYVCDYYNCRAECGPGCGGTCVNNECWCDC